MPPGSSAELTEPSPRRTHPLRERVGDELLECNLQRWLTEQPYGPLTSGRYRLREGTSGRVFAPLAGS